MSTCLYGLLPVIQVPYLDDETIDWKILSREVDWLFEHGSDGLVIAMVSEVLRLTESERFKLTTWLCEEVGGRGMVVVSVGAESAKASEHFASHAQGAGASAVMAIPPIGTACLESDLKRYYERILNAISIPVIVQDASGYVGQPISIELQAALFNAHGPRVMFKPEAPPLGQRLSALREATRGQAGIFEGSGGVALVDSHRRGIIGTMPGADLIRIIAPLWGSLQAGEEHNAWRIASALAPLLSLTTNLDSFLAIEKHLLVRQDVFDRDGVRGPVGYTLDPETLLEVDRLFDRALEVVDQIRSQAAYSS